MAALFGLLLLLIGWQAARIRPLLPPAFESVTEEGEQLFPVAAPAGPAPDLPAAPAARRAALRERSVDALPAAAAAADCDLFVRISLQHWVRWALARERATELGAPAVERGSGRALCCIAPRALVDDRDGDGDPLDPGELAGSDAGAEAELFCG